MNKELRFYKCDLCGKVIEILNDSTTPTICCSKEMKELIPNTHEGAVEKHVPTTRIEGNKIHVEVVEVLHPMSKEHLINFIVLQTNKSVYRKDLNPESKPIADFLLLEDEKPVAVFAYCNLHGLWKKDL